MLPHTSLSLRTSVFLVPLSLAVAVLCGCASHEPIQHFTASEYASKLIVGTPAPGAVTVSPVGVRIDSHDKCWLDLMIRGREQEVRRVGGYIAYTLAFTDHPGWYVLLWEPGQGTVSLSTVMDPPRSATINFARPASYTVSNDGEYVTVVQPVRINPGSPLTPGATFSVKLNRAFDDEVDELLEIESTDSVRCRRGDLVPDT